MLLKGDLQVAVESSLTENNNSLTNKPGYIFLVDNTETINPNTRRWFGDQYYRKVQLVLFTKRAPKSDVFKSIKRRITLKPFSKQTGLNLFHVALGVLVLIYIAAFSKALNKPPVENYSGRNLTATPVYPDRNTTEPEYKPEPHQNNTTEHKSKPHQNNTIEPEYKPKSNTVPDNPIVSIRVDDPSHIQIKSLSLIKKGDVITDDSEKRNNLTNELKSIESEIKNLTNKQTTKPLPQAKALSWSVMESQKLVVEMEKKSFYQAQLKLKLARSMHDSHISQLDNEKAGLKKEVEKLQTEFQLYEDTILGRKDFIKSQKDDYDDYIDPSILPDEKPNFQVFIDKHERIKNVLQEQQAKLNNFANEHQQKLLRLLSEVENAEKALDLAKSRQIEAQQKYEQQALPDEEMRLEQQKQNQKIYDYDSHNRKYQLEELNSRMSEINKELNQIPVFRSPRDGHVTKMTIEYERSGKYLIKVLIKPFPWELSK
jgi:hypothetical protein